MPIDIHGHEDIISDAMEKNAKYLEDEIRKAIERGRWTGYRLAKESGVSQAVVCRFINGQRDITLATASKLVKTLGLELKPKKKGR